MALSAAASTEPSCTPAAAASSSSGKKSPHTVMPISSCSRAALFVRPSSAESPSIAPTKAEPHLWTSGPYAGAGRVSPGASMGSRSPRSSSRTSAHISASRSLPPAAPMRAAVEELPCTLAWAWANSGVEWTTMTAWPEGGRCSTTLEMRAEPSTSACANGSESSTCASVGDSASRTARTGTEGTRSTSRTSEARAVEPVCSARARSGGGIAKTFSKRECASVWLVTTIRSNSP
mmetsp:Transcript_42935/g.105869  ORF Transcript_42935/g.105869 Transcript_42935/m.105869 type:complete len:234 (-) Transcript_42935:651-1352(-)